METVERWDVSGLAIYQGEIKLAQVLDWNCAELWPDLCSREILRGDDAEQCARLMAAAPEMLEALRGLIKGIEELGNHPHGLTPKNVERARRAVARAEGRE